MPTVVAVTVHLLLVLGFCLQFTFCFLSYSGYKLLEIVPNGEAQLATLRDMQTAIGFEVDYWTEHGSPNDKYVLSVSPTQYPEIAKYLTSRRIKYKLLSTDLSKFIQRSYLDVKNTIAWDHKTMDTFDLSKYHSYNEQMIFIRTVAEKYPEYAEVESIGRSYEDRDMLYIRIGYPTGKPKRTVLIDAGFHAREWIAPATALYFVEKLVVDPKYTKLLESIDFVIIPNMNPDGYEYSRKHDRMWRKTRSGSAKGCYGADLNRNFPFKWGYSGSSDNACSAVYRGPEPLSEIESRNLVEFFEANNDSIEAYVTLHSYGQNIIYPWGYKQNTYPTDIADLRALGLAAAEVIRAEFGVKYTVGGSADDLYPASGSSDDYAKNLGIKYVYTFELKPGSQPMDGIGYYGFHLPQKYIVSAAEEASTALLVIADEIAEHNE